MNDFHAEHVAATVHVDDLPLFVTDRLANVANLGRQHAGPGLGQLALPNDLGERAEADDLAGVLLQSVQDVDLREGELAVLAGLDTHLCTVGRWA